ncbi:putative lipoprotein [Leptospira inadai serovar Lyme str. 10]|uniref:Lipoprotein n=2 Tax=Leptospira inadai serovar Lyme TaxID=293084 RepID=A0ABX4YIA5_9LEPT|nr:hypothetical protein [Leptospira inadai]EQA38114.1 putative lipoprotein [Leptospira inadai serovar Lyme str. 10]PNV75013.1 hypothetical protein BES34_010605 [Leptospira inadai serovar Lyme]
MNIRLLYLVWFLAVLSLGCAVSPETVAHKIFLAHGGSSFDKVNELKFTFVVWTPEKELVRRTWTWAPKTQDVSFFDGQKEFRYNRNQIDDASKETEAKFINDSYWLLFPFHLTWDSDVTLTYDGPQPRPDGKGPLRRLSIKYPEQGGFTPGDLYRLYYDSDYKIRYWTYHKNGASEPTRATSWEGYAMIGSIPFSLERISPSGTFKILFQEVTISR